MHFDWLQGKTCSKLLKTNLKDPANSELSCDQRNFWSWMRKKKSKSGENHVPTACGERLPEKLQPTNPECISKCIQITKCKDNEVAKRKLTNCREPEKANKRKISYWESTFGSLSLKKKSPEPSSCRNLQGEKKLCREKDPRLCDPRYKMTAGDAFIFTESPKTRSCKSREPLPKSPPSHKLPRAVFTQKFIKMAGNVPNTCAAAWQFEASCDNPTPVCSSPKAPILPFEELRPPNKRRTKYSCKIGVLPNTASNPTRNDSNCWNTSKSQSQQPKAINSSKKTIPTNSPTDFSFEINNVRGKSRLEQLKKLTRAKEGSNCSEHLEKITQDHSKWRTLSCK